MFTVNPPLFWNRLKPPSQGRKSPSFGGHLLIIYIHPVSHVLFPNTVCTSWRHELEFRTFLRPVFVQRMRRSRRRRSIVWRIFAKCLSELDVTDLTLVAKTTSHENKVSLSQGNPGCVPELTIIICGRSVCVRVCVRACVHVCMCVCTCMCVRTCITAYVYPYVYEDVCAYVFSCVCAGHTCLRV